MFLIFKISSHITQRNNVTDLADYSNQLGNFIRTTELVDKIQLDDDQTDHNFFSDSDEEEFYPLEDSILDLESDLDEHEDFFHTKFLLFRYLVHLIKFFTKYFYY